MRGLDGSPVPTTVGALAVPAVLVDASLGCDALDERFRADARLPGVVVRDDHNRVGLVNRESFGQVMSGPFGFGRALWRRQPVGAVADWQPLVVPAHESVVEVCVRMRRRPRSRRYDDVLVAGVAGQLGRVSAARLFETLAQLMSDQAVRDGLSGLANRSFFLDRLAEACRSDGPDRPAVVFVDLDRMKQVNDALGHNAGDRLIVSAARRLTAAAAPGELVARLGGDEFAVLCHVAAGLPQRVAGAAIGERFRAALAATDPDLPPGAHSRASVGVAVGGAEVAGHTLLTEADVAMYGAKQAGGDAVRVVVDVGGQLDVRHPGLGDGILRAIDDGQLRLHYQPIVDLADGRLTGVEALIRWQHPRHGLLTPDRFLADAARGNELAALDAWVLSAACADLAAWDAACGRSAPQYVNVNLTVESLRTDGVAGRVLDALDAARLHPARLRIELPESADLTVLTDAVDRLRHLHRRGVGITLDDMGAGSSTLRHLSVLPVTGLKIDQAFVGGMLDNRGDHAVVKLLTDLGHHLDLRVTAEGVENARQLSALRALGVPDAQGYHLGRPMPADDLAALLTPARRPATGPTW